jgi:serine protease Do
MVNGRAVGSASDLTRQVAFARPGEEIRIAVLRSGERREIPVRAGLRPAEASLANNSPAGPGDPQ